LGHDCIGRVGQGHFEFWNPLGFPSRVLFHSTFHWLGGFLFPPVKATQFTSKGLRNRPEPKNPGHLGWATGVLPQRNGGNRRLESLLGWNSWAYPHHGRKPIGPPFSGDPGAKEPISGPKRRFGETPENVGLAFHKHGPQFPGEHLWSNPNWDPHWVFQGPGRKG